MIPLAITSISISMFNQHKLCFSIWMNLNMLNTKIRTDVDYKILCSKLSSLEKAVNISFMKKVFILYITLKKCYTVATGTSLPSLLSLQGNPVIPSCSHDILNGLQRSAFEANHLIKFHYYQYESRIVITFKCFYI